MQNENPGGMGLRNILELKKRTNLEQLNDRWKQLT